MDTNETSCPLNHMKQCQCLMTAAQLITAGSLQDDEPERKKKSYYPIKLLKMTPIPSPSLNNPEYINMQIGPFQKFISWTQYVSYITVKPIASVCALQASGLNIGQ